MDSICKAGSQSYSGIVFPAIARDMRQGPRTRAVDCPLVDHAVSVHAGPVRHIPSVGCCCAKGCQLGIVLGP